MELYIVRFRGNEFIGAFFCHVPSLLLLLYRYRDSLRPATPRECYQGMLGTGAAFDSILENVASEQRDRSKHVAVAITKPPETVRTSFEKYDNLLIFDVISTTERRRQTLGRVDDH